MKKFFALSAAAVFFCMFTAKGQELPEQGMNDPGMENNNAEMTKSADALFPYIPRLRTNIAKEDYKVSLERAEKIIGKMEKALLPGKQEREKIVAETVKGVEDKYRSKDKAATDSQFIDDEVKEALAAHDAKVKTARETLEKELSAKNGILNGASASPVGKPVDATRAKAREYAKEQIGKKFAKADKEITEKLQKEAEKKYPLYKKGDKVSFSCKIGRKFFRIENGTYHGSGIGGRSIVVDSRSIPKRNLSSEVRACFDKKENEKLRKRYVDDGMKNHRDRKFVEIMKLTNERLKELVARNDKAGFIFYGVKDSDKIAKQMEISKKSKGDFDFNALSPENQLKYYTNKWVSASTIIKDYSDNMVSVTRKRLEYELKNAITREVGVIVQKIAKENEAKQNAANQNPEENTDNEENDMAE